MDDIFPILMFIIFFLAPLLEGLKRKNKDQRRPPQERPLPRPPQQRLPQQTQPKPSSRMEEVSGKSRSEETAAGMVPDDLWEILTGQKRPPVLTTPPQPQPETRKRPSWDVVYDPEEDEEAEADEEALVREDAADVGSRKLRSVCSAKLSRRARPASIISPILLRTCSTYPSITVSASAPVP